MITIHDNDRSAQCTRLLPRQLFPFRLTRARTELIAPSLIDSYQHSVDFTHHFPHDRAISYGIRSSEREGELTDIAVYYI